MSPTIMRALAALQENLDYTFDDFPMPYDITVNAKNAGKMDVEYQIMGARQSTTLTAEEVKEFTSKMPITEFVMKLKERDGQPAQSQAASQDDDVPPPPDFLA